jgi:DNA-binding LacI/PurR family transcriptional regulator
VDFTVRSGSSAMNEILRDFVPEAVFCTNDYMAAGAIKSLYERGVRVPNDVAVVGYDNNDVSLGVFPTFTTVDNKFEELGKCLATELLGLIDERVKSVRKVTSGFGGEGIPRESRS